MVYDISDSTQVLGKIATLICHSFARLSATENLTISPHYDGRRREAMAGLDVRWHTCGDCVRIRIVESIDAAEHITEANMQTIFYAKKSPAHLCDYELVTDNCCFANFKIRTVNRRLWMEPISVVDVPIAPHLFPIITGIVRLREDNSSILDSHQVTGAQGTAVSLRSALLSAPHDISPDIRRFSLQLRQFHAMRYWNLAQSTKHVGLFVVRSADDELLRLRCADQTEHIANDLSQITSATRYFYNDTIPFDEICTAVRGVADAKSVHEVSFDAKYAMFRWMRSAGSTIVLNEFIVPTEMEVRTLPEYCALTVVFGHAGTGKSTFLKELRTEIATADRAKWVRLVDGIRIGEILAAQPEFFHNIDDPTMFVRLAVLLSALNPVEMRVLKHALRVPGRVVLLLDDVDAFPKRLWTSVVSFIEHAQKCFPALRVWITARTKLCELLQEKFSILPCHMAELEPDQQQEFLRALLPARHAQSIPLLLDKSEKCNGQRTPHYDTHYTFTRSPFNLRLIAHAFARNPTLERSYHGLDLMRDHVHELTRDYSAEQMQQLGGGAWALFWQANHDEGESAENEDTALYISTFGRFANLPILEYFVALHCANHPREFDHLAVRMDSSVRPIADWIDRILFESLPDMQHFLNGNLESIASAKTAAACFDKFGRNPLHVIQKDVRLTELMIANGAQVTHRDKFNRLPIDYNYRHCELAVLNVIVEHMPATQCIPEHDRAAVDELFRQSLAQGHTCIVDSLLRNQTELVVSPFCIYLAIENSSICESVVHKMLEQAAVHPNGLNAFKVGHCTILELAMSSYHIRRATVAILVERFECAPANGRTKWDLLKESSSLEKILYIVGRGSDEAANLSDLFTLATDVDCRCANDLIRYLCEHHRHSRLWEISPSQWDYDLLQTVSSNFSATCLDALLHRACTENDIDTVRILLERGANVRATSTANREPIESLSLFDKDLMSLLIAHGAIVTPDTVFTWANSTVDNLAYCLAHCVFDWLSTDRNGQTLLHRAIARGNIDVMRYALERCPQLLATPTKDPAGLLPLHTAFACGNLYAVECLLDAGADLRATSQRGETVWHCVCNSDVVHLPLIEFLVRKELEPSVADSDGNTICHKLFVGDPVPLERFSPEEKFYSELAVNWNAQNHDGKTPLHLCAALQSECTYELLRFLLVTIGGIDSDKQDSEGRTALHWTIADGHLDTVKILDEYTRLNFELSDQSGHTALDLARHNRKLLEYLKAVQLRQDQIS